MFTTSASSSSFDRVRRGSTNPTIPHIRLLTDLARGALHRDSGLQLSSLSVSSLPPPFESRILRWWCSRTFFDESGRLHFCRNYLLEQVTNHATQDLLHHSQSPSRRRG